MQLNKKSKRLRILWRYITSVWGLLALGTGVGIAAPLNVSDVPLSLGVKVEPNILFVVDDSGSMDWDILSKDLVHSGAFTNTQPQGTDPDPHGSGAVKHRDDNHDGRADCTYADGMFYGYLYIAEFGRNTYHDDENDCETADDREWRVHNSDFNPLYFNPLRTYRRWFGVDKDGKPFTDMSVTRAKADPYDPNSETINLLTDSSDMHDSTKARTTADRNRDGRPDGFAFYVWQDRDHDGLFDNGEEIEYRLRDLKDGDIAGKSAAEVQQNFANWFSYHRSRMLAAKATYGELIAKAHGVRMGLVTVNNATNPKADTQPLNADPTTGHKRRLLDTLYAIQPRLSTPLPEALRQAGLYFSCQNNDFFASCPAVELDQGGACQQNFAIVLSDGFYNAPPRQAVGNSDGDKNSRFDGGAYADAWTDTLADIAMHYYERDLHPALPDQVPTTRGVDEGSHQHMVTYMVTFGTGMGSVKSDPPNPTHAFAWPQPDLSAPVTLAKAESLLDDMRHAAYNGRGQLFSATDPEGLARALQKAMFRVAARSSAAAAVALSAGARHTESRVYQTRFDSTDWSGQLLAFELGPDGKLLAPVWEAGRILDTQDFDTGRTILTFDTMSRPPVGRPFRWAALNAAQQALLSANGRDTLGPARVDYVRGDQQLAMTGTFRQRRSVLGDFVHSQPAFVGRPFLPDQVGATYAAFRQSHSNRTPMIVVGGNDGMLHIFHADTGSELLGYVPNAVLPRLAELTSPDYQHRFYVDGSPTAGDVEIAGQWRTVVVGGLRAGGSGYYALDITDPSTFAEANAARLVLWEFTSAQDIDLGLSFSQASLVRMANGRWAAVFGNGYNHKGSGHAALFLVFLDGGRDGMWQAGRDYIKIDTGVGSVDTPNGLATPAVIDVLDTQGHGFGDFTADFIVAGDLQGNLWKFDVRHPDPGNWQVAYRNGTTPLPLFQARDRQGNGQPITSRPEVGPHPIDPQSFMVYFGTGKYLEPSDHTVAGIGTQTIYGVSDQRLGGTVPYDRQVLVAQTVIGTAMSGGLHVRVVSNNRVDFSTTFGWHLDLPLAGERQVSDTILRNGRVIVTTLLPNAQPCGFGGSSWLMELDALSGGRLSYPAFDLNQDALFDAQDMVSVGVGGAGQVLAPSGIESTQGMLSGPAILPSGNIELKYSSGSAGGVMAITENPGPGAVGRQAWQQIYQ